jgi:DNA (cytosine-5)-methyltransferase 1
MPHEPLTVGSLFAGIGGIDLGLERAGMVTRWFVEWDVYCQNILRRHWSGVPVYGDITTVDWGAVEPVDVLAGGFPCQPISTAGRGKVQADERWLWPEFYRAIRYLRPRYVLVENVAALLGRGMDEVIGDLATVGYDAEWESIPAAAFGAPHLRDRVWIVAYPASERLEEPGRLGQSVYPAPRSDGAPDHAFDGGWWAVEPDVGRVAHGIPHRVDRLRALGNAVVPQVVQWIGERIVADAEGRVTA